MQKHAYSFAIIFMATQILASPLSHGQIRVTIPSFPSCSAPQGTIIASYDQGTHGIPGDYTSHDGKDAVYQLSEDTVTQCFCAANGDGIQTNYWKVSSLSFDEIEYLKALGWIYIPNGADWGLSQAPYMAQNDAFQCDQDPGDDDKDHNDDDDDDDDDNDNEGGIGDILGISTGDVLGLASTGNKEKIALLATGGLLALAGGIYILKKANAKKQKA